MRAAVGSLDFVLTAAFDTPLLEGHGPESNRLATLVHKLFGEPTIRLGIEQAVASGVLTQARIIQPFAQRGVPAQRSIFPAAAEPDTSDELRQALAPLAADLIYAGRAMRLRSLLVLCRDVPQARAVHSLLDKRWPDAENVRRAPQSWPAERIVEKLSERGGVVVAATSRQSVDAARASTNVAVLTPLRLPTAQEIAFRSSMHPQQGSLPLVLDFADAFRGFPNLEFGLQSEVTE